MDLKYFTVAGLFKNIRFKRRHLKFDKIESLMARAIYLNTVFLYTCLQLVVISFQPVLSEKQKEDIFFFVISNNSNFFNKRKVYTVYSINLNLNVYRKVSFDFPIQRKGI